MRALVVEDDAEVGQYIQRSLNGAGYVADLIADGRDALTAALTSDYELMIVDRMLPNLDGLSLVQTIRAAKISTPVILLTSMGSVDERVAGLRAGADDYMVKPFSIIELLARIETIRRRPSLAPEPTELTGGTIRLDLLRREVQREGKSIELQPREFMLLKHFIERPGRVQTRTMLLEAVWGLHFDPKTSVVETHISRLRSKIDKPFSRAYLVTVHGIGYVFQP